MFGGGGGVGTWSVMILNYSMKRVSEEFPFLVT